jgi:hypothetical protein
MKKAKKKKNKTKKPEDSCHGSNDGLMRQASMMKNIRIRPKRKGQKTLEGEQIYFFC